MGKLDAPKRMARDGLRALMLPTRWERPANENALPLLRLAQ